MEYYIDKIRDMINTENDLNNETICMEMSAKTKNMIIKDIEYLPYYFLKNDNTTIPRETLLGINVYENNLLDIGLIFYQYKPKSIKQIKMGKLDLFESVDE